MASTGGKGSLGDGSPGAAAMPGPVQVDVALDGRSYGGLPCATDLAAMTKAAEMASHLEATAASPAPKTSKAVPAGRILAVGGIRKDSRAAAAGQTERGVALRGAETLDQTEAHSVNNKK